MAKRVSMVNRPVHVESVQVAPADTAALDAPTGNKWARASTRVGKKAIMCWVEPATLKTLNRLAVDDDRTLQDIMLEAVERLLIAHNLPRFEKSRVHEVETS